MPSISLITRARRAVRRARRRLRGALGGPPLDPEAQAAFDERARGWNRRCLVVVALVTLLVVPLAAVLEAQIAGGGAPARRNFVWHGVTTAAIMAGALPLSRRRPELAIVAFIVPHGLAMGAELAIGFDAAANELLTFSGPCFFLFLSVLVVAGPRARAAGIGGMILALLAGGCLELSARAHRPLLGIALVLFACAGALAFVAGCLVTAMLRRRCLDGRVASAAEAARRELHALAARAYEERESERKRIARELHDELSQALTAIRCSLSLPPDEARARSLDGLLEETHGSLRRIVSNLRPPMLDDLGLAATVRWLSSRCGKLTGAECICSIDLGERGEADLDEHRTTALFRCLQESLTNVARHARARHVAVRLARERDVVLLRVSDDGVGFRSDRAAPSGHVGLLGMRERARALGAELRVHSRPGAGTEVELRVPLLPAPSAKGPAPRGRGERRAGAEAAE